LDSVAVMVWFPAFSFALTSAIVTTVVSSLVIVPVPVASVILTRLDAFERVIVTVSSTSTVLSPETVTLIVPLVVPVLIIKVPLEAV